MKKVFTSKELLIIDEILNKYRSDVDTTVTGFELDYLTKLYADYRAQVTQNDKLEAENENLKKQVESLRKTVGSYCNHINILRADNSNQSYDMHKLKEENKKLKEKVDELHTIKKSFEVLRALYLGDYEDEPF